LLAIGLGLFVKELFDAFKSGVDATLLIIEGRCSVVGSREDFLSACALTVYSVHSRVDSNHFLPLVVALTEEMANLANILRS